jgi:hypothetical protein
MYCVHGVHAVSWHKVMALPMVWMLHSFGKESFCLSSSAPLRDGGMGVSPCASVRLGLGVGCPAGIYWV